MNVLKHHRVTVMKKDHALESVTRIVGIGAVHPKNDVDAAAITPETSIV